MVERCTKSGHNEIKLALHRYCTSMKSSVLSSAHRSPRRSQSLSRAPAGRSSRPLTAFANAYNQPRERSLLRSLVDGFLFPISPQPPRPKARSLIITRARHFGPTQTSIRPQPRPWLTYSDSLSRGSGVPNQV